jgi:parallel beta-helix repeat protein
MSQTQEKLEQSFAIPSITGGHYGTIDPALVFANGDLAIANHVEITEGDTWIKLVGIDPVTGLVTLVNLSSDTVEGIEGKAIHDHSIESPTGPPVTAFNDLGPWTPPYSLPAGGEQEDPFLTPGSYWSTVLQKIDLALDTPATTPITDTDPGALAAAVAAAGNGDVIEVQTNAIYDPITIPASTNFILRAGAGFSPEISGQYACNLADQAADVVISGFSFPNCTTAAANYRGACVSFATLNSKVQDIIFDRCNFSDVQAGSAVMLSYHWSEGGDSYANPPQPSELSTNVSFIGCSFNNASKEGIEGAALSLRAVDRPFIYQCTCNGGNQGGSGSRGIQLQNCTNLMVHSCISFNNTVNNGEGIKVDTIGSPVAVVNTGQLVANTAHNNVEGIDIDDNCFVLAISNVAYQNTTEGISLDDSSTATLLNNVSFANTDGIRLEAGSISELQNNLCFENVNNNYRIENGYTLPATNLEMRRDTATLTVDPVGAMLLSKMVAIDESENGAPIWTIQPPDLHDAIKRLAVAVSGLLAGPIP